MFIRIVVSSIGLARKILGYIKYYHIAKKHLLTATSPFVNIAILNDITYVHSASATMEKKQRCASVHT